MCPWLNLSGSDRSESSNPSGVVLVWRPAREATIWLFEMNMMFLFSSYVFLKMVYPITQTVFLVSDGSVHQTFWYVRLQKRLNIDGLKLNFLQAFIIPSRWILFNLGTQSFHSSNETLILRRQLDASGCEITWESIFPDLKLCALVAELLFMSELESLLSLKEAQRAALKALDGKKARRWIARMSFFFKADTKKEFSGGSVYQTICCVRFGMMVSTRLDGLDQNLTRGIC